MNINSEVKIRHTSSALREIMSRGYLKLNCDGMQILIPLGLFS